MESFTKISADTKTSTFPAFKIKYSLFMKITDWNFKILKNNVLIQNSNANVSK